MKIYAVGGAIRDQLLGRTIQDIDYVVVGASPQKMIDLNFKPVGHDFPVFLHPQTKAEYALARTERKIAAGYHGFQFFCSPSVTLEDDLARRDLTINAMARAVSDEGKIEGKIIDPYGGQHDLRQGILRHVSPAFREDPVRILRIARFAARLPHFKIHFKTLELMQTMVQAGEVLALVAERVWQELARALLETRPSRFFETLRSVGALMQLAPEINALWNVPQSHIHHPEIDTGIHAMMVIDYAAKHFPVLPICFAALMHDLGKGTTPCKQWPHHPNHEARGLESVKKVCERWRVPHDCREMALVMTAEHGHIHECLNYSAEQLINLLERCDAFRRTNRFQQILSACEADCRGRLNYEKQAYPQTKHLLNALAAANTIDTRAIAIRYQNQTKNIRHAIQQARISAVAHILTSLTKF